MKQQALQAFALSDIYSPLLVSRELLLYNRKLFKNSFFAFPLLAIAFSLSSFVPNLLCCSFIFIPANAAFLFLLFSVFFFDFFFSGH